MPKEVEQEKIYVGTVDDAIESVQDKEPPLFSFEEYLNEFTESKDDKGEKGVTEDKNPLDGAEKGGENPFSKRAQTKATENAKVEAETVKLEGAFEMALEQLKERAIKENKAFEFTFTDENGVERVGKITPASLSSDKENAFNDGDALLNYSIDGKQLHKNSFKDRIGKGVRSATKATAKSSYRTAKDIVVKKLPKQISNAIREGATMGR